ncbi:hypothetical protein AAVH_21604 [Aphelenchoides avenae]|nr:hypothetical protein AAVH_21604 [Aphelenchus avenae]
MTSLPVFNVVFVFGLITAADGLRCYQGSIDSWDKATCSATFCATLEHVTDNNVYYDCGTEKICAEEGTGPLKVEGKGAIASTKITCCTTELCNKPSSASSLTSSALLMTLGVLFLACTKM